MNFESLKMYSLKCGLSSILQKNVPKYGKSAGLGLTALFLLDITVHF